MTQSKYTLLRTRGPSAVNEPPLPRELYRFRTYGAPGRNGADKSTVHEVLAGRIRFARLQDFNDPFEGRPAAVPAFADAGKQRAAMLRYLIGVLRDAGKSIGEARREAERLLMGKSQAEIIDLMSEKLPELYSSGGLLICCLAGPEAIKGPVSWSHYSDHHRGVAIHFSTAQPPFNLAFAVRYTDTYPEVVVPRTHQDTWEAFQLALMTKSLQWKYEDEYRVVRVDWEGTHPEVGKLLVKWEGQIALADPKIVTAITLGSRMQKADRDELLVIIEEQRPDIEVWQADLHRRRYEVTAERIR